MSEDPRCCGSGMCIIDGQGRCWCGQEWDGKKMCTPSSATSVTSAVSVPSGPSLPAVTSPPAAQLASAPFAAPQPDSSPEPGDAAVEDDIRPPVSASRRLLGLAALAMPMAALLPRPAPAQVGSVAPNRDFTATEKKAVQATVQGQLAAVAAGDAARAYGYASPAIQQQFGNAAQFLAMVRAAYPMIVRPRHMAFQLPERVADAVIQPVQLRDAEGRAWLATYQLRAQPGGGWRIAGCIVTADERRLST